jgi:sugar lactone lactonase YvrE
VATRVEKLDPALNNIISTSEPVKEIAAGMPMGPVEGLVWWKEGGYLLFSDIQASKRMKYVPAQGVTLFQDKTNQANGLAFSPDESVLYIDDSLRGHIRAFDVAANGTLAKTG